MRAFSRAVGVAAACCCAAACSNSQVVGSKYAKSQLVQAIQGGTMTVTAADDPTLAGTAIQVPPDSLASDTTLTVLQGAAISLPSGVVSAGSAIPQFGPDATTFGFPATVSVPFTLASGQTTDGLMVVGVQPDGTVFLVDNIDLQIDSAHGIASFTVAANARFQPAWGPPNVCPPGTELCGCCGSGKCIPAGQPCPVACSNMACPTDGGRHDGCCPAAEYFCGCDGIGKCQPIGEPCLFACPAQTTPPVCCPPGEYLCGCNGQGQCVPDGQPCPNATPNYCVGDAGVCPPPLVDTKCGCIPPTAMCVPPDGGTLHCGAGTPVCPPPSVCINGTCQFGGGADGGQICGPNYPACPSGEICFKDTCVPGGAADGGCPPNATADAGTVCGPCDTTIPCRSGVCVNGICQP
jgi:hypothetical protein